MCVLLNKKFIFLYIKKLLKYDHHTPPLALTSNSLQMWTVYNISRSIYKTFSLSFSLGLYALGNDVTACHTQLAVNRFLAPF